MEGGSSSDNPHRRGRGEAIPRLPLKRRVILDGRNASSKRRSTQNPAWEARMRALRIIDSIDPMVTVEATTTVDAMVAKVRSERYRPGTNSGLSSALAASTKPRWLCLRLQPLTEQATGGQMLRRHPPWRLSTLFLRRISEGRIPLI